MYIFLVMQSCLRFDVYSALGRCAHVTMVMPRVFGPLYLSCLASHCLVNVQSIRGPAFQYFLTTASDGLFANYGDAGPALSWGSACSGPDVASPCFQAICTALDDLLGRSMDLKERPMPLCTVGQHDFLLCNEVCLELSDKRSWCVWLQQ